MEEEINVHSVVDQKGEELTIPHIRDKEIERLGGIENILPSPPSPKEDQTTVKG